METAVDQPGMEQGREFLRQHPEKLWPAGRVEQRFQRNPRAVQQRQMRVVGGCQRGRLVHHRQGAEQGRRQRRLRTCAG